MQTSTDRPPDQPAAPPSDTLDLHPAAAPVPAHAAGRPEFGELVADLQEHGLLQAIVLHDGRMLVDVEPRPVGVEGRTPALIGQDGRSSVDGGASRGYDPRTIRR